MESKDDYINVSLNASCQLKAEIERAIKRYKSESDILCSTVIGILEMIKIEEVARWQSPKKK